MAAGAYVCMLFCMGALLAQRVGIVGRAGSSGAAAWILSVQGGEPGQPGRGCRPHRGGGTSSAWQCHTHSGDCASPGKARQQLLQSHGEQCGGPGLESS